MLFTACEQSDWTYRSWFHSHLWGSMWSQVHKCKICHWKWKLDLIQGAWSKSSNVQDWEPDNWNVQFTTGITGTLSDFCNDIKQQTLANWIWASRNKGTYSETKCKYVNTSLKLDMASKKHCIVSLAFSPAVL